ncbi:MAG: chromosome segregation protein SMC [Bdellovibrionales bacterium]|nr:chromosome segregation protein SMC [Bdellovibrionales bacterium]
MRIKKLELIGFKSFKDRTVIHFDKGITGIVGPNGCGKSNIVDALVWVMGEMSAKHLRGSAMSDVIFAGADGYAPVGMAEVSLTLENDGGPFPAKYSRHSEVMITRRLHRSGESEYLVNKEPARLKDIQEVFMDTGAGSKGFSIIEQGAIGKIITAKPEERRTLIEEAAGITKFKARKRESQRKLVSTDQNLVRLQDIIGEQKRQLDSLQRQAQRAERYRNLKNELQDKELKLFSNQFKSMVADLAEAQTSFDSAKETEVSSSAELDQNEARLEELRLQSVEKEKRVEDRQNISKSAIEAVQKSEDEIKDLGFEIEQGRRNKEMTGSILDQYTVRKDALDKDKADLLGKLEAAETDLTQLTENYGVEKEKYDRDQETIRTADDQLSDRRREMLTVSQSHTHLEARSVSLTEKIEGLSEELEIARTTASEHEAQRSEFETRRNDVFKELEGERQLQLEIMSDVQNFEENLNSVKAQVSTKEEEVAQFKDSLNEISSRLYGLESMADNFEGFQEGVKSVMLWQRQRMEQTADGGAHTITEFQPVSEVVEVPQEYELAMEAALGNRLQMLISKDAGAALGAVDYLKEQKSGRSSFVSEEFGVGEISDSSAESMKTQQGFVSLLSDIVRIPDDQTTQVKPFVSGVAIVDSVRTALRLRPDYQGWTFVTQDGDTLTADGVLTGGAADSADSGVLKRKREIKELSQKREEAAGKLSLASASLKKLEAQQEQMAEELERSKQEKVAKEIRITELSKDLERAETELSNAIKAVERQNQVVSQLDSKHVSASDDLEQVQEKMTEMLTRKSELDSEIEGLNQQLDSAKEGIDDLSASVTDLQVKVASKTQEKEGYVSQLAMVQQSLDEVNGQLDKMSHESEKNAEALSENQVLIEERKVGLERLIREREQADELFAKERDEFEQLGAELREIEEKVSKALHERNAQQSLISDAQLKLEQLKMKEQYLLEQVTEKYMLDLSECYEQHVDESLDVKATEQDLKDLKAKLGRIGEVNLSAIEEYDELIGRFEFLNQQYQDLLDAKEQLRKVIDKINKICDKRFKETFEAVNERFMKVFPVLFGGGEARLILLEDPEKGEMGIDIVAKPPGKKSQNVSLLSGGEKALTAVSLIFAIFLVKPSPFCLLDEVDAPLDDANVFRFNDLVKEMAKRSQIIIVTHNKHTMRVNEKLYGVTQEEKGVSKMVSVDLDQAEQAVAQ